MITRRQFAKSLGSAVVLSTLKPEQTKADIAAADQLIEKRPDLFLKVRSYSDLERAQQQRKVGVIFSFEAATMLEDKVERAATTQY